jgi:hypothetical protein
MITVWARFLDGRTDCWGTEGGETDALIAELWDDPEVVEVWTEGDY